MKKILLLIGLGLFFAFPSLAAEYYIDVTSGNDANAGSEAAPWQTLAMINSTNISPDDTVYLKGDFTPVAAVTLDAAMQGSDYQNHTTITNWPGETPTIKLDATFANGSIYIQGNNYTISGIEFHNQGIYLVGTYGINIQADQQYITIENCVFRDAEYGIYSSATVKHITVNENTLYNNSVAIEFRSGEEITITKNIVHDNTSMAIIIALTATNVIYANNYVYNNTSAVGIYPGSITTDVMVINNTIVNNNYGVGCEGFGNGVTIKNNIIAQSQTAATAHYDAYAMTYDYNLYYNNANIAMVISIPFALNTYATLVDWQAIGFDEHSSEADPLFTDSTTDDYSLQSISPAIDVGLDMAAYITDDYSGETRPYNSIFDIGADEQQTPSAPSALELSSGNQNSVALSWTAPSTEITTYSLQYDTDENYLNPTTVTGITDTTVTVSSLNAKTNYYYRIKSIYDSGVQQYESSYTTTADYTGGDTFFRTAPEIPTAVKVKNRLAKSAVLYWQGNGASFRVQLRKRKTNKIIKTFRNNITDNKKKIEKNSNYNIKSNMPYKYRVRACNVKDVCSDWSSYKNFRTKPAKVENLNYNDNNQILQWQKIRGQKIKYIVKIMNEQKQKIIHYRTKKRKLQLDILEEGKTYNIKVRAKRNIKNKGKWSEINKIEL